MSDKGVPDVYIITPLSEEEAQGGSATLLAQGDIDLIVSLVTKHAGERTDLIKKLSDLQSC